MQETLQWLSGPIIVAGIWATISLITAVYRKITGKSQTMRNVAVSNGGSVMQAQSIIINNGTIMGNVSNVSNTNMFYNGKDSEQ